MLPKMLFSLHPSVHIPRHTCPLLCCAQSQTCPQLLFALACFLVIRFIALKLPVFHISLKLLDTKSAAQINLGHVERFNPAVLRDHCWEERECFYCTGSLHRPWGVATTLYCIFRSCNRFSAGKLTTAYVSFLSAVCKVIWIVLSWLNVSSHVYVWWQVQNRKSFGKEKAKKHYKALKCKRILSLVRIYTNFTWDPVAPGNVADWKMRLLPS